MEAILCSEKFFRWHRRLACADYNSGRDARPTNFLSFMGGLKAHEELFRKVQSSKFKVQGSKSSIGCVLRTINPVQWRERRPAPPNLFMLYGWAKAMNDNFIR